MAIQPTPCTLAAVLAARPHRADCAQHVRIDRHVYAGADIGILAGAAALAISRLTGQRRVQLALQHTQAREMAWLQLDLNDSVAVDEWLESAQAAIADANARPQQARRAGGRAGVLLAHKPADAAMLLAEHAEVIAVLAVDTQGLIVISDRRRIDALAAGCLLAALARACHVLRTSGDARLGSLSILSPCERANLLCRYQNARVRRPRGMSLADRVGRMVQKYPEHLAVIDATRRCSYSELWARSGAIAAGLRQAGIRMGDTVATHGTRSVGHILALLAVLRVGAVWLPVPAAMPTERINRLLAGNAARCVIACGDTIPAGMVVAAMPLETLAERPHADEPLPAVAENAGACVLVVEAADASEHGIEISHRSVLRALCDPEYLALSSASAVRNAAPVGSDAYLWEVFAALLNGGSCLVHDDCFAPCAASPSHGGNRTISASIALMSAAAFERAVAEEPESLAGLRQLVVAGASLAVDSVRRAQQQLPQVEVIRAYGPSECAVLASTYRIPLPLAADCNTVPVGLPVAETSMHVLAADGGLLPIGAVGEIHLGGCGVPSSYRPGAAGKAHPGRPGRENFVPDPYGFEGDWMYRTGDHGRRRADGNIELCERIREPSIIADSLPISGVADTVRIQHVRADLPRSAERTHWPRVSP